MFGAKSCVRGLLPEDGDDQDDDVHPRRHVTIGVISYRHAQIFATLTTLRNGGWAEKLVGSGK